MKTVVSRYWDPDDKSKMLGEADKAVVRENLLEAIVFAVPVVRTQLGLCLRSIANADFPQNWPSLVPAICTNLQQQQPARLYGRFGPRSPRSTSSQDVDGRDPLHDLVEKTWPLLGNLLTALVAQPSVEARSSSTSP